MRSEIGPETLLRVSSVTKKFGGFVALNSVSLEVRGGERLGLIGPNGSGKSTLVNCICGALKPESGHVAFDGEIIDSFAPHRRAKLGLARSFQLPRPFASMTVLENVRIPLRFVGKKDGERRGNADIHAEAMHILDQVGLADKAATLSSALTQVDMRKLELARAVAVNPRLLVADESMAGLSTSEVDEILQLIMGLKQQGIAVIMIEHIMRAVMTFSERIVVLVAGQKIADGDPKSVMARPEVVRAYLGE
ncbi:MAG: ABC transporter ATP-binding protein [Proteobacteria bacterium SG_bin9]|nr:MAG: ABC transporter ATP-binding protein [Proteobacteria bacterium SG_bin9]